MTKNESSHCLAFVFRFSSSGFIKGKVCMHTMRMWPRGGLLLALLATMALFCLPLPAQAQGSITVRDSQVEPDFPSMISFSLTAESSGAEIIEAQLLYGAARDGALTIVDLELKPGQQVEVRHELDTQLTYLPPGTEVAYRWLIRDSSGNELVTELQTFAYHDTRFDWGERTERNVTVYWYEGGEQFGDELIGAATASLDKLQSDIGAQLDKPVKIYIYANTSDMRSAMQSNEVEWVGGQANTTLGIILGTIEPGNSAEVERIIPHELSHQVLHQAIDNPYGGAPVWFDEGLAVYNQAQLDAGFPELVDDAASEGRLVPLEALSSSFPADPDLAYQSYAQSESVVAYIVDAYGTEKVQELVAAFSAALTAEEAVQQVLGLSIDELDTAWRATLPPQINEPAVENGPLTAPDERFDEPLPGADPDMPVELGETDTRPALVAWIESLPSWASLSLTALCCVSLMAVFGVGLLVFLRVIGVDKQVS
jgi:Peptidase MA superfamily